MSVMTVIDLPVVRCFDFKNPIGFSEVEDGRLKIKLVEPIPVEEFAFHFGFKPIIKNNQIIEIEMHVISIGGLDGR